MKHLALCLFLPIFAAQTALADDVETLVVTAHRIPGESSILPVIVHEIADANAVGADALRGLPSLAISQSGSLGGVTQVRVRGSEANHLLVLLDGVEAGDPANGAEYDFANLALYGASHLEYLPGAQSAVWGSDALAGVLNLSTEPTEKVRRLDLESGSFGTNSASIKLTDRTDTYYYNVSLGDFGTAGTNTARTGNEDDGYDNRTWLFSGGLLRDDWSLKGFLRGTKSKSEFDPTPFPSFLPVDGNNVGEHDETLAMISLGMNFGPQFEERLTASFLDTENESKADSAVTGHSEGRRLKVSSVTRYQASQRQHWDLLIEHEEERFSQRGSASIFGNPNQDQAIRVTSAALEYVVVPFEPLSVAASVRYDDNSDFENSTSHRLAVRYQLFPDTSLWLNWGTGIKNPSFIERFGFTPDSFIGNPELDPEFNRHLSIGVQHQIGRISLRASAYRDRLEDEINGFAFDATAGGFTAVNQRGRSERDGLEAELHAVWENTALAIGVSFLDASEPDNSDEIRRPELTGHLDLSHRWRKYSASISVFYVDEHDDFDFGTFPAARVTLDDYTLVRAAVHYTFSDHVEISVRGENLLDERYEDLFGYRTPGSAAYIRLGVSL